MIKEIKYRLLHTTLYVLSLLPLSVLYVLSDFIYLILYSLVGYRKEVVRKNLKKSFPTKSDKERKKIEKTFYHWFCDYMVETIKLCSISETEIRKRMVFEGIEQIQQCIDEGRPAFVYLGHYCNWEWITSFSLHMKNCISADLYHALESESADRLFINMRERFGAKAIKMEDTLLTLSKWRKEGKNFVVGFVADQVPGFSSMHYWPTFLNQLTPTYSGTERIAKIFDGGVFYMDIERPKRGYYVTKIVKICDYAKKEPKFSLTERYYRLLENSINSHPGYWLWTHNRWKRTWEDFCNYFPDENERKRILNKL